MNEPVTPPEGALADLDFTKQHILVCDRARPHVKYQQGPALYDRKGHYVEMAAIPIYLAEPKAPPAQERVVTQRTIGSTKKTVVSQITDAAARAVGAAPSKEAVRKTLSLRGLKDVMPDSVTRAVKENQRAAAAEQAV